MTKVALVTGSNKGIGFAIVRGLCKQFSGDVYLLARDAGRGKAAVAELEKEGLHPKFHQLDITDKQSCEALATFIKTNYKDGIDMLINNAGMAYKQASTAPFSEQAEVTVACNYYGTLNVCNALFPLLKAGARVVHVSSMTSNFAIKKCSAEVKARFLACRTIAELSDRMDEFVKQAKAGTHEAAGFASSAYGMSKVGVSMMTSIQQAAFDVDKTRPNIVVNAICPGYVDTDMSSHKGTKTIDQGAETPLYAAFLPPNTDIRGKFLSEKAVRDWTN